MVVRIDVVLGGLMIAAPYGSRNRMFDSHQILSSATSGLGLGPSYPADVRRFTSADGTHSVGVFRVSDCPDSGVDSWGTVAMSFFYNGMKSPAGKLLQIELVTAAGSEWDVPGSALASCALRLAEGGTSCNYDAIFRDAFTHGTQQVTTPHAIFIPPITWGEFSKLDDDDASILWLQMVGITSEEAEYARAHSVDALSELFEQTQPDIYDLQRQSALVYPAI
ncbi:suppressor of fused domain protein [Agreia pratensis]|uniref:suppressor of fused domain protein n=1 Tax=Agreia pratensis TaxID=150121 RepID=UPI00188D4884|nr:suppressor of fused domain protein [Agreia pratensis]MBF4635579.1 suppressor of fused domain protein [Agreia pratensis]